MKPSHQGCFFLFRPDLVFTVFIFCAVLLMYNIHFLIKLHILFDYFLLSPYFAFSISSPSQKSFLQAYLTLTLLVLVTCFYNLLITLPL